MIHRTFSLKTRLIFGLIICLFLTSWFVPLFLKNSTQSNTYHQNVRIYSNGLDNNIWERQTILDPDGRIQIKWNFTKEKIIMTVVAATTGYVGVGFSLNPNMSNADIIIGWIQDTEIHVYDYHANNNSQPVLDEQQDLELISGAENKTHSMFSFQRKLKTCDKHDIEISTTTVYALWSFHDKDPEDKFTTLKYHGRNRGFLPVHLLDTHYPLPSLENVEYLDIGANRTKQIFKMLTFYYWCKFFKIPNFGEKHHLIGYVPLIQQEHLHLVHHILIYECGGENLDKKYGDDAEGHMCWTPWNFENELSCRKEIVSWTIGSKGEFFPLHVGYPFGSSDDKPQYVSIQIHYSYEYYFPGLEDSSKIRLYHTKNLRPNDASTINIAAKHFQIIPPKQPDFPTIGICSPTCTKEYFPPEGIRAFRYLLHGHKAVAKMRLHHFRDGKEINTIVDDNLHFNYQQARYFKEELIIKSGDWLGVECIHDTTQRSTTTVTGLDSEQEMCIVIMQYYPPTKLDTCYSVLRPDDVHRVTGNYHFSQKQLVELADRPYMYLAYFFMMSLYIKYRPLEYHQVNALRRLYMEGNQIPLCLNDTFSKFEYHTDELISFKQGQLTEIENKCQ